MFLVKMPLAIQSSRFWPVAALLSGLLLASSMAQAQSPGPAPDRSPVIVPAPAPAGEQRGVQPQADGMSRLPPVPSLAPPASIGQTIAEGRPVEDRAAVLEQRLNVNSRRAINSICRGC